MKKGKTLTLLFGVAIGTVVSFVVIDKINKKAKNVLTKKPKEVIGLGGDDEINYI